MLRQINSVEPEPQFRLRLTYTSGESFVVDFSPLIDKGGVFAPLAATDFFAQVRIGEGGRYIEWPGGVDFCADALWLEAQTSRAES